jgi:Skp family chaperone for outer membrane proteins
MKRPIALGLVVAVIAALLVAIGRQAGVARTALPLAYISMPRILSESEQEKATAGRLTEMQQQKTLQIAAIQREYEATRRQLAQLQGGLSSSAKQAQLEHDEQRLRADIERATAQAQTDLQALQRQVQTDLRARVMPIVESVAKSRGVQLILHEEAAVLWATPGLDLTNEVLGRLKVEARPAAPK